MASVQIAELKNNLGAYSAQGAYRRRCHHLRPQVGDREEVLSDSAFRVSCECFSTLLLSAKEILPSANAREIAFRQFECFLLRAADALQLAAALVGCGEPPRGRFVRADRRLAAAATTAGFEIQSV